jgi:hypothetical protein
MELEQFLEPTQLQYSTKEELLLLVLAKASS